MINQSNTKKRFSDLSIQEVFKESPQTLLDLLRAEYDFRVPECIDSIEDMRTGGALLAKISNTYAYIVQLSCYAKIEIRRAKNEGRSKKEIDDAIDRKYLLDGFINGLESQYKAVSRVITIKQEINAELKMTDGR